MKKQESPVLEVCRVCAELRGELDVDGVRRRQRCACEPREPEWPRYDFNCAREPYRCCGADTIRHESRVRDLLGEIDGGDGAVPLGRYLEVAKRRAEREPIDALVPRLAAHLDGGTP